MSTNSNLNRAKAVADDEFYTPLAEIEREVAAYRPQLAGKKVLCNCDDPEWSNFYRYFDDNFDFIGLESLVCTHFERDPARPSYALIRDGEGRRRVGLKGNGDFRSPECLAYLMECDVVVTNPPFSLFGEFVDKVAAYGKDMLVIGPMNALTYCTVFPLVMEGRLGTGLHHVPRFTRADGTERKFGNVLWYTTLDHRKRHGGPVLFRKWDAESYPVHDAYPAAEVSRVKDIPSDYGGVMAVPVTYIEHHDPAKFEIVGTLGAGGPFNKGGIPCGRHFEVQAPAHQEEGQLIYTHRYMTNIKD